MFRQFLDQAQTKGSPLQDTMRGFGVGLLNRQQNPYSNFGQDSMSAYRNMHQQSGRNQLAQMYGQPTGYNQGQHLPAPFAQGQQQGQGGDEYTRLLLQSLGIF